MDGIEQRGGTQDRTADKGGAKDKKGREKKEKEKTAKAPRRIGNPNKCSDMQVALIAKNYHYKNRQDQAPGSYDAPRRLTKGIPT